MGVDTATVVVPVSRQEIKQLGDAPIQPIRVTCRDCGCWHALLLLQPSSRGAGICPRCSWGVEHSDERELVDAKG